LNPSEVTSLKTHFFVGLFLLYEIRQVLK